MLTSIPTNSPLGGSGPRRLSFATQDPEAGIEVLEQVYAIRRIEIDRATPFSMAQAVRGVEGLHLEQARLQGAPAGALVDATGIVRVGQVYDGAWPSPIAPAPALGGRRFCSRCAPTPAAGAIWGC